MYLKLALKTYFINNTIMPQKITSLYPVLCHTILTFFLKTNAINFFYFYLLELLIIQAISIKPI